MQKFYSIVLMAVALLLGTNVKAATLTAGTPDDLVTAFKNAQDGDEIQLTADITIPGYTSTGSTYKVSGVSYSRPYQLPFITIESGNEITLNMNGKNIQDEAGKYRYAIFYLKEGKLNIINNGTDGGTISCMNNNNGMTKNNPSGGYPVFITGNNDSIPNAAAAWSSVLTVGDGVTLQGNSSGATIGIGVNMYTIEGNFVNGISEGVAYEHVASTGYYVKHTNAYGNKGGTGNNNKCAFNAKINVESGATMKGNNYGVQILGTIGYIPNANHRDYLPTINIANGAEATTLDNACTYSVGAYCAGYGVLNINGEVHGATGVYVKAGEVNVGEGAVVYSDATAYSGPKGQTSSVNASGSAIVYESSKSYVGDITINVEDKSTIGTANGQGYTIEGLNSKGGESSELKNLNIEGGTLVAGNLGSLEPTVLKEAIEQGATFEINGATVTTDASDLEDLNALIALTGATTLIGQTEDGTYVFTQPEDQGATVKENVDLNTTTEKYVELNGGAAQTLTKDVELTYLLLQNATVNVPAGMTLKVGSIVMDASAVINVAAGAKLVITGENGLVANNVNNIKIAAKEGAMGQFLLSPAAKANKTPSATVTLETKAYKNGDTYVWERIGCPAAEGIKAGDIVKNVTSYIQYWDPIQGKYVGISGANHILQPFQGLSLTNDAAAAGQTYQFPCKLVGNTNGNLQLVGEWTSFANSYMADVDLFALLGDILAAGEGVSATVYVYDAPSDYWKTVSYGKLEDYWKNSGDKPAYTALEPIQGFIFNNLDASINANAVIDYENDVWDPVFDQNHAVPQGIAARRNTINNTTRVQINITGENGQTDEITLRQSEDFSAAFDNGYDAKKNIEINPINIFATTELGNMAELSSDNIIGTNLSIATKSETTFKMTFSNLNGEQLAIRDNLTGSVIDMTEGAEYFFTANEGDNANRFQIIGINNAPTAIENVATEGAKAVYTVLGQYMGTTDNWNTLPNGIYVVDGVKMVK